ncbi:hypothetical protein WMZ97_20470 [Lentibacillus sp. N15]|uniref:SA1320 family protein n=1 Tax=Lentibacillus songyuanensis TaxID=3136161 RepID=UPI0031BBB1C2
MVEQTAATSHKNSNTTNSSQTMDTDLVELAGYHAYKKYKKPAVIQVNGKEFEVKDSKYNTESGLDAPTVQNIETDELTIIFVGSEQIKEDWLETNPKLLGDVPPQQIKDAQDYFDDICNEFGDVSAVTGNSLGGALTNAVAIEHPEVKAVTYNPAILPDGMTDPDNDYANITNYFGKYDPLTTAEQAIKLDNRIPGNHFTINNGLPLPSLLGSNHTGYVDKDKNGDFTITVGTKGKTGYGVIHVGADDHIVTSLWTGEALYGGPSQKVEINKANMLVLADGLHSIVNGRLGIASGYLDNSVSIVKDESDKFYQRVTTLQEIFEQMLYEAAGDPLFKGIAKTGYVLITCMDELIRLLNTAKEKCHFLNTILNSKPMELIEHITSINIRVEALFDPPKQHLHDLRDNIVDFVSGTNSIIHEHIPKLLEGGKDLFVDAVVDELNAHYETIEANKEKLTAQLTNYEQQIRGVANAFDNTDHNLADAIATKSEPLSEVSTIPETEIVTLETSPYLKDNMKIKELQVNGAYTQIKVVVNGTLLTGVTIMNGLVLLIEKALEAIIFGIDSALNVALYGNPAGWMISLFTNYDQQSE